MGTDEELVIGTPVNNNHKVLLKHRIERIRTELLSAEEIYYSFRDDIEDALQKSKFQLDKLEQMLGEIL